MGCFAPRLWAGSPGTGQLYERLGTGTTREAPKPKLHARRHRQIQNAPRLPWSGGRVQSDVPQEALIDVSIHLRGHSEPVRRSRLTPLYGCRNADNCTQTSIAPWRELQSWARQRAALGREIRSSVTRPPGSDQHPRTGLSDEHRGPGGGTGGHRVWVEDVLPRGALVEVPVAARSVVEAEDRGVDGFSDLCLVRQNQIHQLAVIALDRALAGGECVGLRPPQAEAHTELTDLGVVVDGTRIAGHVQAGDTQPGADARNPHDVVQDGRRCLRRILAVAAGLETHGVHRRVDFRLAENLLDLLGQRSGLGQVNRLAAEAAGLIEAGLDHVPDDDDGGAEQLRGMSCRQTDGASAGDVDTRACRYPRGVGAVVAGREDIREHGEVENLLEGLVAVGELKEVEIREWHHDVLGLPANPAAHINVAIGRAGACWIDIQADTCLAFVAHATTSARDIERRTADVALLDEQDIIADLYHFAGDLVPERLTDRRGRAASHHMLVAATDVGRDQLEN